MFSADPRLLQRIAPLAQRVLILDPMPASAKLLGDLMKGMGSRELLLEQDERRALELARDFDPQIVFTERSGPRLDGEAFARRLRRSEMSCRQAPIIMVTADATASTIKGARDAGVHEFLRRPFTAGDLLKRVENVLLKPRDWVEAVQYVGPDRRRFNSGDYSGPQKRTADKGGGPVANQAEATDQAVRILRAALNQFDRDPMQALRAMRQQALTLKAAAVTTGNTRLGQAVAQLQQALQAPQPTRGSLEGPATAVLDLFEAEPKRAPAAAAGLQASA